MEPTCIDASLLGTDRHLVRTESGFSWRATVPPDTWHLTGAVKPDSDWCLDSLLRLGGLEIRVTPPDRFVNAMTLVASGSLSQIPWQKVMPGQAHRDFARALVQQVDEALAKAPLDYYRRTWVPGNTVLRSLQRAKVDGAKIEALLEAGVGNARVVAGFAPEPDGFARPITYDRFGALTGRLTVTQGPSILTLKREYRDIVVPAEPGHIVGIDFAALEARVLLYEAGRRCDETDLYAMIARELGYERKAVKGAVISELYGSSKRALGAALGIKGKELDSFVRQVRNHFQTKKLLKRIKSQFFETGRIINRYGRPVLIDEPMDHVFINYYAQSSGADITLVGFSQMVNRLATEAPGVRPLFLIHDAIFLDVPERHLEFVKAIDSVTVPGYVQHFPLKVTVGVHS